MKIGPQIVKNMIDDLKKSIGSHGALIIYNAHFEMIQPDSQSAAVSWFTSLR